MAMQRALYTAIRLALIAGIIFFMEPARPARAANFAVTRFDDPPPNGCQVGNCSLREAVIDANASAGADTISLSAGTYSLTRAGANEFFAATGDLNIWDDLTITTAGAAATIDATGLGDRVFSVNGIGVSPVVSLANLIIRGGNTTIGGGLYNLSGQVTLTQVIVRDNAVSGSGGGIYNSNGQVTLIDSQVLLNTATNGHGGGITNYSTTAPTILVLDNTTVRNNDAGGEGGGIYSQAVSLTYLAEVTLQNGSSVKNNSAGTGGGISNHKGVLTLTGAALRNNTAAYSAGGLYNVDSTSRVVMSDSTLSGNQAAGIGGAIRNQSGVITLTGTLVSGNSSGGEGGGIHHGGTLTMTLIGSTVSANSAGGDGGGIYTAGTNTTMWLDHSAVVSNTTPAGGGGIWNAALLILGDSLVDGNSAANGGGIQNVNAFGGPGKTVLNNSTVSDNFATDGGGVYNSSTLNLNDTTVSGNTATRGGGAYNEGVLNLNNTTVSANSATDGGGIYSPGLTQIYNATLSDNNAATAGGIYTDSAGATVVRNSIVAAQGSGGNCFISPMGTLTSGGYNLESGIDCGFTAAGDQQNTDPFLLPLGDFGGATLTHALSAYSTAADTGDPAGCLGDLDGDGGLELLNADQRGQTRVGGCDIGAFEILPLLMNSSFEADLNGNGIPDGWDDPSLAPGVDGRLCPPTHWGSCSMHVNVGVPGPGKTLRQNIAQAGNSGDTFTFSSWVATQNVSGQGKFRGGVRVNYTNAPPQNFFVAYDLGSYGWRYFERTVTVTDTYTSIDVIALHSTLPNGEVVLDDVSLVRHP